MSLKIITDLPFNGIIPNADRSSYSPPGAKQWENNQGSWTNQSEYYFNPLRIPEAEPNLTLRFISRASIILLALALLAGGLSAASSTLRALGIVVGLSSCITVAVYLSTWLLRRYRAMRFTLRALRTILFCSIHYTIPAGLTTLAFVMDRNYCPNCFTHAVLLIASCALAIGGPNNAIAFGLSRRVFLLSTCISFALVTLNFCLLSVSRPSPVSWGDLFALTSCFVLMIIPLCVSVAGRSTFLYLCERVLHEEHDASETLADFVRYTKCADVESIKQFISRLPDRQYLPPPYRLVLEIAEGLLELRPQAESTEARNVNITRVQKSDPSLSSAHSRSSSFNRVMEFPSPREIKKFEFPNLDRPRSPASASARQRKRGMSLTQTRITFRTTPAYITAVVVRLYGFASSVESDNGTATDLFETLLNFVEGKCKLLKGQFQRYGNGSIEVYWSSGAVPRNNSVRACEFAADIVTAMKEPLATAIEQTRIPWRVHVGVASSHALVSQYSDVCSVVGVLATVAHRLMELNTSIGSDVLCTSNISEDAKTEYLFRRICMAQFPLLGKCEGFTTRKTKGLYTKSADVWIHELIGQQQSSGNVEWMYQLENNEKHNPYIVYEEGISAILAMQYDLAVSKMAAFVSGRSDYWASCVLAWAKEKQCTLEFVLEERLSPAWLCVTTTPSASTGGSSGSHLE